MALVPTACPTSKARPRALPASDTTPLPWLPVGDVPVLPDQARLAACPANILPRLSGILLVVPIFNSPRWAPEDGTTTRTPPVRPARTGIPDLPRGLVLPVACLRTTLPTTRLRGRSQRPSVLQPIGSPSLLLSKPDLLSPSPPVSPSSRQLRLVRPRHPSSRSRVWEK